MSAATPIDDTIPASRLMRERDDYRARHALESTRADRLERERAEAVQRASDWEAIALSNGEELAKARVELARAYAAIEARDALIDSYAREVQAERRLSSGNVAAYQDAIREIYDATRCQTGPVVDVVHQMIRALADADVDVDGRLFDICQFCGPYDAEENPMPGCRYCFGGKVVA